MTCLYENIGVSHEPIDDENLGVNSHLNSETRDANSQANSHKHRHEHSHSSVNKNAKALKISLFITFATMIFQFIYAIISNSLALMSDTLHMLTHVLALGLSWFAIYAATNWKNPRKTFGYYRFEILAAFVNSISAGIFSLIIIYEAIMKLISPEKIEIKTMLIVAVIGLCVNIITGLIMLGGDMKNLNIKSSFVHMMSDLLSSLAIVIGGAIAYFTGFEWIDGVLALIIAAVIAKWSFDLVRQSVNILLEASPLDLSAIEKIILEQDGVLEIHDLHISQITQNLNVLTAHVVIRNASEFKDILQRISTRLKRENIAHITLQPEWR